MEPPWAPTGVKVPWSLLRDQKSLKSVKEVLHLLPKIQFNSIQLYFHKNTTAKIHQEKKTYIQQNHMEE